MRIRRIQLINFKPYKKLILPNENDVFPRGLILIEGPNSTGKTSILDSIIWALWGPTAIGVKNEDLIKFGERYCRVMVEFEVDGKRYLIDRSYDRSAGMQVVLYQYDESKGKFVDIASKSGEVSKKMQEVLQIDYKQALSTVMVRQGEVNELAVASPASLRELISKVYSLDLLEKVNDVLKKEENLLNEKLNELQSKYVPIERIEKQLKEKNDELESKKSRLKERKSELEGLKTKINELPNPNFIREIEATMVRIEDFQKQLVSMSKNIEESAKNMGITCEISMKVLDDEISKRDQLLQEKLKELENIEKQVRKLSEEIGGLHGLNRELKDKISKLQKAEKVEEGEFEYRCPICGTPLSKEKMEDIVSHYEREIEENNSTIENLVKKRNVLEEERSKTRIEKEKILVEKSNLKLLKKRLEELENNKKNLTDLKNKLKEMLSKEGYTDVQEMLAKFNFKNLKELHQYVISLNEEYARKETEIDKLIEDISKIEREIDELRREKEEMIKIDKEIKENKKILQHLMHLRRVLMKNFLSQWVVQKRLLGTIKHTAASYLLRFTCGQYSNVDLVPTKPTGERGSGILLTVLDESDGIVKSKDMLSFGDRTAVGLALRLGISKTMSRIKPLKESPQKTPRIRCVLLDEPLGGLDVSRRKEVVDQLVEDEGFEQIFLITHMEIDRKEEIPRVIVRKEGNVSVAEFIASKEET
ncbi:MAG: AAA family ATPase [Candidatus Baldrarchaeota archaeon]